MDTIYYIGAIILCTYLKRMCNYVCVYLYRADTEYYRNDITNKKIVYVNNL